MADIGCCRPAKASLTLPRILQRHARFLPEGLRFANCRLRSVSILLIRRQQRLGSQLLDLLHSDVLLAVGGAVLGVVDQLAREGLLLVRRAGVVAVADGLEAREMTLVLDGHWLLERHGRSFAGLLLQSLQLWLDGVVIRTGLHLHLDVLCVGVPCVRQHCRHLVGATEHLVGGLGHPALLERCRVSRLAEHRPSRNRVVAVSQLVLALHHHLFLVRCASPFERQHPRVLIDALQLLVLLS